MHVAHVNARPSCRSEPAIRPSSRPGPRVIEAIIGTDKGLLNERCRPGAPGQRPRIAHTHSQDSGAGMISHNMHTGIAGAHGGNDERATPLGGHAREAQRQHPQRARAGQTHRIGPTHHAFTLHEAPHVTLTAATDAAAARLTLMQLPSWHRWCMPTTMLRWHLCRCVLHSHLSLCTAHSSAAVTRRPWT